MGERRRAGVRLIIPRETSSSEDRFKEKYIYIYIPGQFKVNGKNLKASTMSSARSYKERCASSVHGVYMQTPWVVFFVHVPTAALIFSFLPRLHKLS